MSLLNFVADQELPRVLRQDFWLLLNPDEMLNADLKQTATAKAPARTKGQLLKVTTSPCASCRSRLSV